MEAATLQVPKSGRSRFSKALPAPPSLPAFDFESQGKALPVPPPPKAPALERDMAAKPLDSPLPPLPANFSTAPPPPMSIPRRPVASPVVSPTRLTLAIPAPALAPPDPSPSPVGSLSSLLSAYSNHTTDYTPQSLSTHSETAAYSVVSPNLDTKAGSTAFPSSPQALPTLSSAQNAQKHEQKDAAREELPPPPPPFKDAQRGPTRSQTPTSFKTQAAQPSESSPSSASPQQEKLWRRRSRSLKADKSLVVPDLKLLSSHGSTAASALQSGPSSSLSQPLALPPQDQTQTSVLATTPRPQPHRNPNVGLPGRNIRPVGPSEQPASLGDPSMGQGASRVKEKLESVRKRQRGDEAKAKVSEVPPVAHAAATQGPTPSRPVKSPLPAQRLPTPEYGSNDVRSPLPEIAVSPLSPASSPEPPGEPKPTVAPGVVGPPEGPLRHAKSALSLVIGPSHPGVVSRSPVGLPRSPAPGRDGGANQTQSMGQISSRGSDELQKVSKTGSLETVKVAVWQPDYGPAMEALPLREADPNQPETTDNPGAARFPRNWYRPLPADEILDARPLRDGHFRCLTQHRYMTASRQRTNPIGCRTCGHKDRNAECYICSACHLNVCSGCSGLLRRFRGDLRQVLRHVEERKAEMAESDAAALQAAEESVTAAILLAQ